MQKLEKLNYKIEDIISKSSICIKLVRYSICEIEELDLSLLNLSEKKIILQFKSIKRQNEYYFTRLLWKYFGIDQTIQYSKLGRPFLESGHISISHSNDIVAIAFNPNHAIGIDVEYHSKKIENIKHKFISKQDELCINPSNKAHLTLVWSIKEAVYKMENIPGLSFKENIHVTIRDNEGFVEVKKDNAIHHYNFKFILNEQYVLTYCSMNDLTRKSKILKST